jgi:predicted metal-dependent peptidase
MTNDDFDLALSKAKIDVMLKSTFFSSLLLSLPITEGPTKTISTDGTCIIYNRAFMEGTDTKYWPFLLTHESIHVAFEHGARRGARDPDTWNIAADIWTNYIIEQTQKYALHPKSHRNDVLAATNSVELIYKALKDMQKDKGEDKGDDPGAGPANAPGNSGVGGFPGADIQPSPMLDIAEAKAQSDKAHRLLAQATTAAHLADEYGDLPGDLRREIDGSLAPKLSWQEILRRFVSEKINAGTTWTKRNRRFTDIYMPSHQSLGIRSLLVAVDTSGSISKATLAQFMGELNAIREDTKPALTTVLACDARIKSVQEFDAYEDIVFKGLGGGGTNFAPVWDFVQTMAEKPAAIIYFTDGMGHWGKEPQTPVLWALTRPASPPFGQSVFVS